MNGVYLGSMEATAWVVASATLRSLVVRGGLFLGLVIALGVVIGWVRRWRMTEPPPSGQPWTLQDLRELHAAGQLSDEEFERLKSEMIAQYRPSAKEAGPDLDLKDETADSTSP